MSGGHINPQPTGCARQPDRRRFETSERPATFETSSYRKWTISGMIRIATMFVILIMGLIAGP
ncbi:MAG TPA: hypothetical protein VK546_01020, partial [Gaiellales bacterium]|nr:hypothetical protein [Gaiellales bacterium]